MGHAHSSQETENLKVNDIGQGLGLGNAVGVISIESSLFGMYYVQYVVQFFNKLSMRYDV